MESLGLKINLSKTIISNDFIEFAKRFTTPSIDLSPIGAGNVLSFMRKPVFISSLIKEAYLKGYIISSSTIQSLVSTLDKRMQIKYGALVLWTSQSVIGFLTTLDPDMHRRETVQSDTSNSSGPRRREALDYRLAYFDSCWNQVSKEVQIAVENIDANATYFFQNWWHATCAKQTSFRVIESLQALLAPGFWLYALSFERSRESVCELLRRMYDIEPGSMYGARELLQLDPSTGLDLNWRDRKMVSRFDARFREINHNLWSLRSKYQSDPNLFSRSRNFHLEYYERVSMLAHSTRLKPWDLCESHFLM
jgi:hypothetical protein